MGNSAATGHIVTMTNIHYAVGFKTTLQVLMRQHNIEPWALSDLTHSNPLEKLQKQAEVRRISPFRFISVDDGLSHYSKHAGGWVARLTRERFTQLSLQLFELRGLTCPIEEAMVFYDVFDSIDLYGDAALGVGELVGGLSTFFAGTLDQRSKAVCGALGPRSFGRISKSVFSQFLKPYVWSLVPDSAEVLRPILLSYVTDEILIEMSSSPSKDYATFDEFARWVRLANPNGTQLNDSHQPFVFAAAVFERCATTIEAVLREAWEEYKSREALREYGQQTWEIEHGSQTQRLSDVGMYRYVVSNYGRPKQRTLQNIEGHLDEEPSLVRSVVSTVSMQVQEAMEGLSLGAWRSPSTANDEFVSDSEDEEEENENEEEEDLQSVCTKEDRTLSHPLPTLLQVHATSMPPPLSSLPAKACGLTRPLGFPEVETRMQASKAF